MRLSVAAANIAMGVIYVTLGCMAIADLRRERAIRGFSHFGLAFIALAFTCGPHHLEHGLHVAFGGRQGGPLDLVAVLVGVPAGVAWFLLRIEARRGGRGDRFVSGTPRWLRALPVLAAFYLVVLAAGFVAVARSGADLVPRLTPNVLLIGLYGLIGYYLSRTQLANRTPLGGWSLSGMALTLVFPTCALMHAVYVLYASVGRYDVEAHGLVIDWLSVPAAIYFVWVVRSLYLGAFRDWNEGATGAQPEVAGARREMAGAPA